MRLKFSEAWTVTQMYSTNSVCIISIVDDILISDHENKATKINSMSSENSLTNLKQKREFETNTEQKWPFEFT